MAKAPAKLFCGFVDFSECVLRSSCHVDEDDCDTLLVCHGREGAAGREMRYGKGSCHDHPGKDGSFSRK
jgi:hypothetical protein